MCFLKRLRMTASTLEAYNRLVAELEADYGEKYIYGEFFIPIGRMFWGWPDFQAAKEEVANILTILDYSVSTVFVEVWVIMH